MRDRRSPALSVATYLIIVTLVAAPFYLVSAAAVMRGDPLPEWILGIMFAPAIAALLSWAISGGRPHPGRLRPVPIVLGLVLPVLIAVGYLAFVPLGVISFGVPVDAAGVAAQMPVAIVLALGEEFGWRGYLLPHLRRRFGFGRSNTIVAVVWCLYHAPLIALGLYGSAIGAGVFTANVIMFSFLVGVLWEFGGGVLSASLAHGAWNVVVQGVATVAFVGSPILLGEFGLITTAVLAVILVATMLTLRSRGALPFAATRSTLDEWAAGTSAATSG
jgi:membrane protease YdiL (CAAX protease family)